MRLYLRLTIITVCLVTIGCFEEPVQEHVHLTLLGGGAAVVTTVQEVAAPWQAGSNPVLAGRLDDSRSELQNGWDRWRLLYDQLTPAAERYSLELVNQLVRRTVYGAVLPSFEPVERFLAAEGLSALLSSDGLVNELQLYPAGGTRATWRQRQDVDAEIDRWAIAVAHYLDLSIELYAYLERRPDRVAPCLAHIFDDHGPASGPLEEHEQQLVLQLKPAIERVADILLVADDRAFSPNELSRLAFDPFPAMLTVAVEGHIVSSDGFTDRDGILERPRVDLWTALQALEGRWLSPDLVTAMVAPTAEDRQPDSDPVAFASRPRHYAAPPGAAAVASALRENLVPRDVHVVRWRPLNPTAPEFENIDARRYLNRAESALLR